ncbi:MAG: GIY-YIG nuclease family protein [Armatimonadota bacterium]|nr:GIY-YIG nuclease family protein [Armatimonadota bacterium]
MFVYIMTNKRNGTLYVGVTGNLERRVAEHKTGAVPGFTSKYGLTKLVWYEQYSSPREAIYREKQIKNWRRAWKIALIEKHNPEWQDLAECFPGS